MAASIPPNPDHNYIYPRGSSLREAQQIIQQKSRRERRNVGTNLPNRHRPTLQNIGHGGPVQRPVEPVERAISGAHLQERVTKLETFQKFQVNQQTPDYRFEMMKDFGKLSRRLPQDKSISSRQIAIDQLAKICISTKAFIKVPGEDSQVFEIWGSPEEVTQAKEVLKLLELPLIGPGSAAKAKEHRWIKQGAVDAREEDRALRAGLKDYEQEALRYADDSLLPYEAHLLWPEGYDLENFIEDYDTEVLADIRSKFACHISHSYGAPCATKISCETKQGLFQVYNRLLGLMKEMIAKKKQGQRIVLCHRPGNCQKLKTQPTTACNTTVFVPIPVYFSETALRTDTSTPSADDSMKRQYRNATKKALRSCISGLHLSEKHVRMRTTFGVVALTNFKRPSDGSNTYGFDSFSEMLGEPGVATIQCPLATGVSYELLDHISAMPEFGEPDLSWTVECHFAGLNGTLMLEKEFTPSYIDPDEPNSTGQRWLDIAAALSLLDVTHMVPGSIGYQLTLGAADIHSNLKTKQEQRSFANDVKLRPSLNGMRFAPGKHAIFPPSNKDLLLVKEVTIAKYSFKDTKGTFEIRRTDTFPQNVGQVDALPRSIVWTGHYYYEEWDRLMSQFGNIRAGDDVEWRRDLTTFFPKVVDEEYPTMLPVGWRKFMDEVEEIRGLLAKATTNTRSDDNEQRNGTNGT